MSATILGRALVYGGILAVGIAIVGSALGYMIAYWGGLGLTQRRRLELLYPERHTLQVSAAEGQFATSLRLLG